MPRAGVSARDVSFSSARDVRFTHAQHHDVRFARWLDDLHVAVRNETWDAVPALMRFPMADARVVLYLTACGGQTRLVEAILHGFAESDDEVSDCVLMSQISNDSNLSDVDAAGAAVAAAQRGHHHVLCVLLRAGVDANAVDTRGVCVLTAAAGGSNEFSGVNNSSSHERERELARSNVEILSNADSDSPLGETNRHRQSHAQCVTSLLNNGADPDAGRSRLGWKPLLACAKTGNVEIARSLLNAGANKNVTYHNGKTPLFVAAEWGNLAVVNLLLEHEADPGIGADRLYTNHDVSVAARNAPVLPRHVARKNGHEAVADALRRAARNTSR